MVYRYTKTTDYTRFNFRKLQISILTYKKGLPYSWYTGIRRLPKYTKSIQKTKKVNFNSRKGASILMVYGYTKTTEYTNSILENFIYQFKLTKRGFYIDGIRVYEDYRVYKILFQKTSYIKLNLQKGASTLMVYGYTKTT